MDKIKCFCDSCIHHKVCAFEKEYSKVVEALNIINLGDPFGNCKCLVDFDWIESVEVKCKHYRGDRYVSIRDQIELNNILTKGKKKG